MYFFIVNLCVIFISYVFVDIKPINSKNIMNGINIVLKNEKFFNKSFYYQKGEII